jgi:DNA processing protein
VVSGLARGIDGEAHRGTLDGGGLGVAVLGSGPDIVYPPEHRGLHDAITDGRGAVVTEYPPGTPPEGWRFPPRNRIIAGLAAAVVVVEAARTGGALITAGIGAEWGRAVMAVPGDVGRGSSAGCNLLIRDGAVPVMDPDDFVEAVSLVLGPARRDPSPAANEPLVAALGVGGLPLEEAAAAWSMDAASAAAAAARLEVAGLLRREAGLLVPVHRAPGR